MGGRAWRTQEQQAYEGHNLLGEAVGCWRRHSVGWVRKHSAWPARACTNRCPRGVQRVWPSRLAQGAPHLHEPCPLPHVSAHTLAAHTPNALPRLLACISKPCLVVPLAQAITPALRMSRSRRGKEAARSAPNVLTLTRSERSSCLTVSLPCYSAWGWWVGGRCNTNLKEWFVSSGSSGPAAAKVCSPPPHLEALQLRCRPLARFDAAGAQDHVCTGVRQRPARL